MSRRAVHDPTPFWAASILLCFGGCLDHTPYTGTPAVCLRVCQGCSVAGTQVAENVVKPVDLVTYVDLERGNGSRDRDWPLGGLQILRDLDTGGAD